MQHYAAKMLAAVSGMGTMQAYIVDDDPLARRTVTRLLSTADIDCETFGSAAEFLSVLDTLDFGCVLLDIDMPGESGLDALAEVLRRQPVFPVVMLSGSTHVDDAIASFRQGALHFLRKPYRREELLAVLTEAERVGIERLAAFERQAKARSIHLTTREREVLVAMAEGQQSKQIAWTLKLSIRTVEMHRSNILTKLSARNASQAVAIARSLDLIPQAKTAA